MQCYKNLISIFILSFFFNSCSREWSTALYVQKIEGTSKILYKYDASGGRDTMVSGYILLDSTETFEVDISKNLPFSYLEDIPNKKLIKGIEFEQPNYENSSNDVKKNFAPIKESSLSENGLKIKTKLFQYEGFMERNSGLGTFEFENFKETRDSIIFYNLNDIKSMEPEHLDSLKIKKTNIVIRQKKNLEIISIDIEDLILSKNTSEIISNKTYFLTPKKKMKSNSFTDYGIFKEQF